MGPSEAAESGFDGRPKGKGDRGKGSGGGRGRDSDDRVDRHGGDDHSSRSERAPWFDMDPQGDSKKPWTLLKRDAGNAKGSPESSHGGSPPHTPAGGFATA